MPRELARDTMIECAGVPLRSVNEQFIAEAGASVIMSATGAGAILWPLISSAPLTNLFSNARLMVAHAICWRGGSVTFTGDDGRSAVIRSISLLLPPRRSRSCSRGCISTMGAGSPSGVRCLRGTSWFQKVGRIITPTGSPMNCGSGRFPSATRSTTSVTTPPASILNISRPSQNRKTSDEQQRGGPIARTATSSRLKTPTPTGTAIAVAGLAAETVPGSPIKGRMAWKTDPCAN